MGTHLRQKARAKKAELKIYMLLFFFKTDKIRHDQLRNVDQVEQFRDKVNETRLCGW